jgi:hypothetical protein
VYETSESVPAKPKSLIDLGLPVPFWKVNWDFFQGFEASKGRKIGTFRTPLASVNITCAGQPGVAAIKRVPNAVMQPDDNPMRHPPTACASQRLVPCLALLV